MVSQVITVRLEDGLHARPAAELVRVASRYESDIKLKVGARLVDAKSVLGLMTLVIRNGTEVEIQADGGDEQEALGEFVHLLTHSKRLQ